MDTYDRGGKWKNVLHYLIITVHLAVDAKPTGLSWARWRVALREPLYV